MTMIRNAVTPRAFTAVCCLIATMAVTSVIHAQEVRLNAASDNSVVNGYELPDKPNVPSVSTTLADTAPTNRSADNIGTGQSTSSSNSASPVTANNEYVSSTRLTDMLRRGGVLMVPIGICSLILLVFVFERLISLRKGRIIPGPFVTRVLEQVRSGELNRESAVSLCERNASPIANVFKAGFMKWGRPSVEIEQAVLDEGERESNRLRRYLRLINGVATVCPLLGMLGTVLGMIHAFDAIAATSPTQAEPSMTIATGISQAMLTTAAGLTVAIPALIAYLFFSGRADRHVMELDSLGMKIVNLVSSEALTINRKTQTQTEKTSVSTQQKTTSKKSTRKAA